MDRDLWLSSGKTTLGAVLATQADMDDVLRAASAAAPPSRRARLKAERRLRKAAALVPAVVPAVELAAVAGEEHQPA